MKLCGNYEVPIQYLRSESLNFVKKCIYLQTVHMYVCTYVFCVYVPTQTKLALWR